MCVFGERCRVPDCHVETGRQCGVKHLAGALRAKAYHVPRRQDHHETPAAVLVRKAIGIESGSATPNTAKVGKITRKQLEDIAKVKAPDMTAASLDAGVRTIAGSARSMGVDVVG